MKNVFDVKGGGKYLQGGKECYIKIKITFKNHYSYTSNDAEVIYFIIDDIFLDIILPMKNTVPRHNTYTEC